MPQQEVCEWSIDGTPVRLVWDSASAVAPGGYDRMTARVPLADMPVTAGPFSILKGVRSSGKTLYIGEIDNTPKIYHDEAVFSCEGLKERITRQRGRRLYQDRALANIQTADSDPFVPGAYVMDRKINVNIKEGRVAYIIHPGDAFAANDRSGIVYWARGDLITRLAFDWAYEGQLLTSFELRIYTATGPSGAMTLDGAAVSIAAVKTGSVDRTLTTPSDLVAIYVSANAIVTPAVIHRVILTNLRFNGRTLLDTLTVSDVGIDVAGFFGWSASTIPDSGQNVLPQNWLGAWPDALTNIARMIDGTWLVIAPPDGSTSPAGFYVGPWGRNSWTVSEGFGADYSGLDPVMPANQVLVEYPTPAGVIQQVSAYAATDPYAGTGLVVSWPADAPYQMQDPQNDDVLATALANNIIGYVSGIRVRNTVHVAAVMGLDGWAHPWDIQPGDLITPQDMTVRQGGLDKPVPAQRAVGVVWNVDGTADVTVTEDVDPDGEVMRLRRR